MTVSSSTRIDTGTAGTGAAQTISFTFPVQLAAEVKARKQEIATGDWTELTKDTDYTVSLTSTGNNNYTGSITTLSPYISSSYNIFIYADTTATQAYNPINNDDMDAESLEAAIDKLFMLVAELQEEVSRCIKIPRGETSTVEVADAVSRVSTTLGFDSNGDITTT